jgi:hypothetical protein
MIFAGKQAGVHSWEGALSLRLSAHTAKAAGIEPERLFRNAL